MASGTTSGSYGARAGAETSLAVIETFFNSIIFFFGVFGATETDFFLAA